MSLNKWKLAEKQSDDLLEHLLLSRGIQTDIERRKYLSPDYDTDTYDPFLLTGMEKSVERVLSAIKEGEKIVVIGDYDADGVPGTTVITSLFSEIGFSNFDIYIPDRHKEGYGMSPEMVEKIIADGAKVIITVDCGITDVAEAEVAKKLGADLVITDHHLPQEVLPEAFAIINPKLPGDEYPDKMLAGAGVAFKLVQGLVARGDFGLVPGWEKWLLDLVAIATVSDMVPLVDENRVLSRYGLLVLRKTRRLGLKSLLSVLKINPRHVTEDDIGFMIGPRINSASRMAHASEAYELLTTTNVARAKEIASSLEGRNNERKKSVDHILNYVKENLGDDLSAVLVIGHPSFSPGVLGLAASRLVEKYSRPVFVWGSTGENEIKGSARSDGSINLVELMALADPDKTFFKDFGGHAMAGGFSIDKDNIDSLSDRLSEAYVKCEKQPAEKELIADAELPLELVDENTYKLIEAMMPFGVGNPKPIFLLKNLPIKSSKTFGNGGIHLEIEFAKKFGKVRAIGFFSCPPDEPGEEKLSSSHNHFGNINLDPGEKVDILATFEKSHFLGRPELRLRLVDIRKSE